MTLESIQMIEATRSESAIPRMISPHENALKRVSHTSSEQAKPIPKKIPNNMAARRGCARTKKVLIAAKREQLMAITILRFATARKRLMNVFTVEERR